LVRAPAPVEAPVPPSATAKSVMPVTEPPVIVGLVMVGEEIVGELRVALVAESPVTVTVAPLCGAISFTLSSDISLPPLSKESLQ
jgi:hypothetical protein